MCASLRHRGPDGSAYAVLDEGRLLFGHVRLSIIDLEGGDQPLFNEDGTMCLVANGEIYDHEELRAQLQRSGHRFRTRSDSEIILHLYEEHGLDLLSRLNGEFAFVLWDKPRRRLLAAKDRFGIRPLYYASHDGRLLLGSEAKAMLCLPGARRRISADYLAGPMLGSTNNALSAFDGIGCLRPGHYLLVECDGVPRELPYWKPAFEIDQRIGFEEACDGLRSRFRRAVRRRLVADVPVVAHLSGGVDSTIICREIVDLARPPQFFTVGFGDSIYDESASARATAAELGVPTEVVPCTPERLADGLEHTVWHTEAPLPNLNSVGKQMLSAQVRERGYKVCLVGAGADELFGGYAYFKLEALWRQMLLGGAAEREAAILWSQFKRMEHRSEGTSWRRRIDWRSRRQRFGYPSFLEAGIEAGERLLPRLYTRQVLERVQVGPAANLALELDLGWMRAQDPFNATRVLSLGIMTNHLIPKMNDRVEMANAVECRTPFLDVEVAEYALRLPPRYFLDLPRLREKHLLYEAYADVLPAAVKQRHKHPFLAPSWRDFAKTRRGRELLGDHLSRRALRQAGIFAPAAVAAIVAGWRVLPAGLALAKRLDAVVGAVLTQQILCRALAERALATPGPLDMRDRSWSSVRAEEGALARDGAR